MRIMRSVGLSLLMASLGTLGTSSRGADSVAEARLKHKGLNRSGHAFVIEAEAPVLAKFKELRVAYASYTALIDRRAQAREVVSQVAQLQERRAQLQSDLDDLNQQIDLQVGQQANFNNGNNGFGRPSGMNFQPTNTFASQAINQRLQIKGELARLRLQEKEIRGESSPENDQTDLDASFTKKEEALKTALEELRPLVDGVRRDYADLANDETVKKAMVDIKKTSRLKLGPSDAFNSGEKLLAKAERQLPGKTTSTGVRKKPTKSRR